MRTIEILSYYLPHELRVRVDGRKKDNTMVSLCPKGIFIETGEYLDFKDFKPILKEFDGNLLKEFEDSKSEKEVLDLYGGLGRKGFLGLPLDIFKFFASRHCDLFGLLNNGEAVRYGD